MHEPTEHLIHKQWIASRVSGYLQEPDVLSQKAGLIGSSNPLGQAAQGVAGALIPGDLSNVRSPARSAVWSAVTPGGIRKPSIRRAIAQEREYRCPEGYQYGGRFTDSKWSTCGRQLFDLPTIFPSLLRIAERAFRQSQVLEPGAPDITTLRGQEISGSPLQSRAAQIPRVTGMSKKARDVGTLTAIQALTSNSQVPYMMIRRDGFPMMPVVSVGELRKVPDNRNMEDAVFLMQAANIDMLGREELGLLSNTGVTSLVYVFPNGSSIRMDRTRPLTVGERRKLGKTVSAAAQVDNSRDPLIRLQQVISESGGAISLRTNFEEIDNPEQSLTRGKNQGLPRWTIEAFKPAEGRTEGRSVVLDENQEIDKLRISSGRSKRISDIETAIEHINSGGNLSDINPSILNEAIERARVYRRRNIGSNRTLFLRTDGGISFVRHMNTRDYEGIGQHIASEIQQHLGLPAPAVRLMGAGKNRPYLVQTPESMTGERGGSSNLRAGDLPATDLATLLISDYLADTRNRNPGSLSGGEIANRRRAVSASNVPSALAGLNPDEIKRRFNLDLPDYLRFDGSFIGSDIQKRNEALRRQILSTYEALIERARQFEWDNYIKILRTDGNLSTSERRHVEIIRSLFDQRLRRLGQSVDLFRKFLDL